MGIVIEFGDDLFFYALICMNPVYLGVGLIFSFELTQLEALFVL